MTISFKISDNTKDKMIEYFADKKREKTPDYAIFQADEADTVVTLYESGKVVFQGISADIDAAIWKETEKKLNPTKELKEKRSDLVNSKDKTIDRKYYYASTIGSDEVGTGDFFGPIVVTATYVKKEDIPFLEELGVKDSKQMTDEKIKQIVPQIIKKIPYASMILTNLEYNEKYSKNMNMNKIKALLHNKVLLELNGKYKPDYTILDEFAKPKVYYSYLKDSPRVERDIVFLTKAENKTLSVAAASLISRFIFLNKMDSLSKELGILLPKGASNTVDEVGIKIAKEYGFQKLKEISKLNFKNSEKIKEAID